MQVYLYGNKFVIATKWALIPIPKLIVKLFKIDYRILCDIIIINK